MQVTELLTLLLLLAGAGFFLAGTVGLLRFPDVYTPCSQKTHPYRDINILPSIVRVTTPLCFASNEA